MNDPVKEIENKIYGIFSDVASCIGYSPVHGKIIGALLVNGEMSLENVAKKTGYSMGMISLSLDLLETLDVIKKIKKSGHRKLYVNLSGDLLGCLKKAFLFKLERGIDDSLKEMGEWKRKIKRMGEKRAKKILRTIKILEREIKKLERYIKILQ